MREIKFRVWDKSLKYMHICGKNVHDDCFYDENNNFHYYNLQNGEGSGEKGDYILMQYTGLKDKNGTEIYEGDIVKLTNSGEIRIAKVIYEHSGFTIDITNMDKPYGRVSFCMPEKYIEVIGNIYDNPELLKGEENG